MSLVVDLFAGGGGASVGIEAAIGRPVDLAVNHDATAIAVHRANHPRTIHLEADVWEVRPRDATQGQSVELLWCSPNCTHFSRAKGAVPLDHGIRSLAWVVVDWAKQVGPRVIMLENVPEFAMWGPLGDDGRPCKRRAGETYDEWVQALRRLGYELESRILDASLYGAPTRRRRLFVVARRDGEPIRWPERTHGPGQRPVRVAAECIDWSLPCPSIFDRKRPLAPATLRRVAEGIRRYVLDAAEPFIVLCNHGRDAWRGQGLGEPMGTVTAAHDARGLVVPTLIQTGQGERPGQAPRVPGLEKPLGTVVGCGQRHALVAGFLARHFGGMVGQDLRQTMPTVTARDHHSVVAAHLTKFYGTSTGSGLHEPVPTITAGAGGAHQGLVAATVAKFYGTADSQGADEPLHTITAKARFALVAAFLQRHGIDCGDVATVRIGEDTYAIADIGLRMLEPHELLRAQFGDFAEGYDLSAATTKAAKIRLIGNSVCPDVARALVAANLAGGVAAPVELQEELFR